MKVFCFFLREKEEKKVVRKEKQHRKSSQLAKEKKTFNFPPFALSKPQKHSKTMALSRYDPFLGGSSLYDPFSLFLGAPLGGGQLSSSSSLSRGGGQQLSMAFARPLHMDVKGKAVLSLFLSRFCCPCEEEERFYRPVRERGWRWAGFRGRKKERKNDTATKRRRRR